MTKKTCYQIKWLLPIFTYPISVMIYEDIDYLTYVIENVTHDHDHVYYNSMDDQVNGKDWSENFESRVNKYHENYNSLSANEKKTVLGAMHQFIFRQIFQTGTLTLDNLDSERAVSQYTGSLIYQ